MGKELIINGALLIAFLFFLYQLTDRFSSSLSRSKTQVIHGLGYGLLGVLLMLFTVKVTDHVIIDFRTIPIMLAAAFGGPFAAVLAALIIGTARVSLFGVSFASEMAAAFLPLIAFCCSLIHRFGRAPRREWAWMIVCSAALSSICLMLIIPGTLHAVKTTSIYCLILIPVSALSFVFASVQLRSHDNAKELKRKTTELTEIFDHVGSAIWSWNRKTGEISISREIEQLCGYDHAAFRQDPLFWRTILHPEDNLTYGAVWERVAAGENITWECRLIQPSGRQLWVQESFRPLLDEDGRLEKVIGAIVDITPLKEQEQLLRDSRNRISITLDSIGDGVITTDAGGVVRYLNPVAAKLTQWEPAEAIDRKIEDIMPIFHETTREPVLSPVYRAVAELRPVDMPAETCLVRRDGSELAIDDSASPIYDDNGRITGVVLVFRNIQERRLQEERIRHYAFHDALTGLPNRRYFRDKLAESLDSQPKDSSLALLFIDLDHFKMINDSLGHEIGDLLLIEVARRLKECVREQDTVSRLAGDEFTVILKDVTLKEAGEYAISIRQSLSRKYRLDERECFTSPSIGISLYPQDGRDVDTLIKCADTAMYHVKTREKNHFRFYSADMTEQVLRKVEIDKGLRGALETNSLRLEYQPKIDLETGKLTGFEALLRWDHPEWGAISPEEFIPVAEESGLIIPLGEWVLRNGCRQFRKWLSNGDPGERLAVNLSVKQLQDPGLPALVERVLEEERLSAGQLELEITETIMKQGEHSVRILKHLKSMGIYISIDDFGTGYSSLSYLNRLPVDALKIDKSFIRNIYAEHADSEIVTTIITLAKSLNLKVIAEGVETAEQLDFLRANNCHEGQGYLIGRPSRPEVIEEAFLTRQG